MLLLVLGYLARENFYNYYVQYGTRVLNPKSHGQAIFVRQMNERELREGREVPYYYSAALSDSGMPWDYPNTRFLNRGTPGRDMYNPSSDLPVIHDEGRDVIFLLWGSSIRYISVIKEYYPQGEQGEFRADPNVGFGETLFYYLVRKEQIEASRRTTALYSSASSAQEWKVVERQETSLGGPSKLPSTPLKYPIQASWTGGLLAPIFGKYRFQMSNSAGGNLVIDGNVVLSDTSAPVDVSLARGVHDIELKGTLSGTGDEVKLMWDAGSGSGGELQPIPPIYLYSQVGNNMIGEAHAIREGGANFDLTADVSSWSELPVLYRSTDGCLGYLSLVDALGASGVQAAGPFVGRWVGQFKITQAGEYTFDLASDGHSIILIDNRMVVDYPSGNPTDNALNEKTGGTVSLSPGEHLFEVRYLWSGNEGSSTLEAYVKLPGGQRTLVGPSFLHPVTEK